MPAYVPSFQYDVFLSYAQVIAPKWVEGFRQKLQEQLDQELHEKGACSIFWDLQELDGDSPLSAEITQALSNTATLVIVLSRAYRDRPWCRKECEYFLTLAGPSSRRIFVVLIEDIPPDQRPPKIQALDVLGFDFFEQHPESKKPGITRPLPHEEAKFDARLRELAKSIAERLTDLKQAPPSGTARIAHGQSRMAGAKVFLADGVSGHPLVKDLEADRAAVRTWLTDRGVIVLPERAGSLFDDFYQDRKRCEATVSELLAQAAVFVQLLGKKGDDEGYETWLCVRAQAAGKVPDKDLLLWRAKSLTQDNVKGEAHRELVFGERVVSCDLRVEFLPHLEKLVTDAELAREAARRASANPAGGTPGEAGDKPRIRVLVDAAAEDRELIERLRKQLRENGLEYEPALSEQDFLEMASQFAGIAFTFGGCSEDWVKTRLRATRPFRLNDESSKPPRVGVYRAATERELPGTSGMDVIVDGDPTSLAQYVKRIQGALS